MGHQEGHRIGARIVARQVAQAELRTAEADCAEQERQASPNSNIEWRIAIFLPQQRTASRWVAAICVGRSKGRDIRIASALMPGLWKTPTPRWHRGVERRRAQAAVSALLDHCPKTVGVHLADSLVQSE
jgi:hypothetical protein